MNFHTRPDYLNPDITSINRCGAHSPMGAFASEEQALLGQDSPYKMKLDGQWLFSIFPCPEQADHFYATDYDVSAMQPITVPGNWETQGFDEPIYTNLIFPWSYEDDAACNIKPSLTHEKVANPPYIPAHNPTGCYRRSFLLPENFDGREVFVYFEGVETAYYLWVNGQAVGYSEDSKLPSSFNLTPYLVKGENSIALQVMRFSTSTYMEDQDYWYLSGIFRSVQLVSKPKIAIEDYKLTAIPNLHHLTGVLSADVTVTRKDFFADYTVRVGLYDGNKLLAIGTGAIEPIADYRTQEQATANTARVILQAERVELWTPDEPKLYRVVLSLLDKAGNVVDAEGCNTGFKTIEVQNGIVLLNGERLVIRGVNRHEHYPMGRAVPKEHMVEEIRQMKRMNMNSVRTCHYPDSPLWYDLCDQYGILLICECNLETHGVAGQLSHNPSWAQAYLERAVRMVQTHKNHVSIYSWSLGNESGTGYNHAAMFGFIKEYDHTRLCQYEAGEPGKNISDIRGNMYATIGKIEQMLTDPLDDRPIILVEYLYQISNSGGGANLFRRLTEKYPRFQGGYVWDWQDKCLLAKTPDGKEFFAYGGDFNESYVEHTNPTFMTNNGVVLPNLRWKPVAFELKQVYAPIYMEKPAMTNAWQKTPAQNLFTVKNRSFTRHLCAYTCTALLKEDGLIIAQTEVALPNLAPNSEQNITVEIPHEKVPGREYHIDFVIREKDPSWYSEQGDFVFATQFTLASGDTVAKAPVTGPVTCTETEAAVVFSANGCTYAVSKTTGTVLTAKKGNTSYLAQDSIKPSFARASTGIDAVPDWGWYKEYRAFDNLKSTLTSFRVLTSAETAEVVCTLLLGNKIQMSIRYTIESDGSLTTDYCATISSAVNILPRVGLELTIPAGFETLSYFGRGENETYSDRVQSARLGVYSSTVEEQHFPFIPPAENGGHEETRWLSLTDGENHRLSLRGTPFHFDIHHNTVAEYLAAKHDHELIRHAESTLHIDCAHSQIGSEMAWSTGLNHALNLKGGSYFGNFTIVLE